MMRGDELPPGDELLKHDSRQGSNIAASAWVGPRGRRAFTSRHLFSLYSVSISVSL